MNFRCYFGNAEVAKKLVGAFDTNPSAAPLTGSIANRLHPDTEKESQGERLRWALARPNSGIQCFDFKRIPKGATMRSLIIMTILCLISSDLRLCVSHGLQARLHMCGWLCSNELRSGNDHDDLPSSDANDNVPMKRATGKTWKTCDDDSDCSQGLPLHQGFRPPGCLPRPLTASRDGTYGGIAGDPALHQKKKPGNGPDFSAV